MSDTGMGGFVDDPDVAATVRLPKYLRITDLGALLRQLCPLFERAGDLEHLTLDLRDVSFVGPTALAALMAATDFLGSAPRFRGGTVHEPENPNVARYFERMDFFHHLGVDEIREVRRRYLAAGRFVELRAIHEDIDAFDAGSQVADVIAGNCGMSAAQREGLEILILELCMNFVEHAGRPGFVMAQYYPRRRTVELGFADTGLGIPATLATVSKYRFDLPQLALAAAIRRRVSSKDQGGEGLFWASELLMRNSGTFKIASERGRLHIQRGEAKVFSAEERWRGTLIGVVIDLDQDLDIRALYDEYAPEAADFELREEP